MTIELEGNWKKGFAYDVHTLSSVYLGVDDFGHDQWDTVRSEMGELLYQLKYQGDKSTIEKIVDLLEKYKGIGTMDAIIPVPSTKKHRAFQPVIEIAKELGKRVGVPVIDDAIDNKAGGKELKGIDDPDERNEQLKESMFLTGNHDLRGKNVLLIDDLYRSGATLSVAAEILYGQAKVKDVFVLTMTKTRSKR